VAAEEINRLITIIVLKLDGLTKVKGQSGVLSIYDPKEERELG